MSFTLSLVFRPRNLALLACLALLCMASRHTSAQTNHYGLISYGTVTLPVDMYTIYTTVPFQGGPIAPFNGIDIDYGYPVGLVARPDLDPTLAAIFPAGVSYLTYPNGGLVPEFVGSNAFVQVAVDAWTFTVPQSIHLAPLGLDSAVTFWFLGIDINAQVRIYELQTDNCT